MKIGDSVRIRKGLMGGEHYDGCLFNPLMEEYRGKDAVITKISSGHYWHLDISGEDWAWSERMLELVKEGKKMKNENVEKHVVIIDSCNNLVGIRNSFREAESLARATGAEEPCTIYHMVPVAHATSEVKVIKIKKVAQEKSVQKKK